jgi:hypothetical protein
MMSTIGGLAVLALAQAGPPPAGAEKRFPDVQYIQGHPSLGKKKTKGTLRVDPSGVVFLGKQGQPLFRIPIEVIREVEARTVADEFPAPPDTRDYLGILTSGLENVDAVIFRTPRWQAESIAVTVNFLRARAEPPPR